MIIYKNTNNYLDFTGFEAGVLVNPNYLFEFIKDDDGTKTYCIGVDISANKIKHNLCLIVEKILQYLQTEKYIYCKGFI